MRDRLEKMKRIAAVQADLHRLAEWRLAALQQEARELDEAQEGVLGALTRHETFQGVLAEAMSRRLGRLSGDSGRVKLAQSAQERRVTDAALKLKRTERAAETLRGKVRRLDEKEDFQELLDTLAADKDASLP